MARNMLKYILYLDQENDIHSINLWLHWPHPYVIFTAQDKTIHDKYMAGFLDYDELKKKAKAYFRSHGYMERPQASSTYLTYRKLFGEGP